MRKQMLLCFLLCLLSATVSSAALVFTQTGDEGGIYVMDDKGTNVTRLIVRDQLNQRSPKWSPDGKQIVFERGESFQHPNISIMNADGTDIRDITPPSKDKSDGHPCFFPNGQSIVFTHSERDENDNQLRSTLVMNLATGKIKKIRN